jgi:adenine-specific DNA methylase
MQYCTLIETILPLEELSREVRREKTIRRGHLSTLHVWWARQPLVAARAAILGALVTVNEFSEFFGIPLSEETSDELLVKIREFFQALCKREVYDGNPLGREILEKARALIRKRFPDGPPKVLDSFAGGGSIPLEALRLGCQAYALDYNPVAYLILKATIEYPQRYGPRLAEEVKRWGDWIYVQAWRELSSFYPADRDGTPSVYIWSRTVRCANPNCQGEVPLFRRFWLAWKKDRQVALKPIPNPKAKRIDFAIVEGKQIDFDPTQGTIGRGGAVCLLCHTTITRAYIKAEAQAGRLGHRLIAVVIPTGKGRRYRLATQADLVAYESAVKTVNNIISGRPSRVTAPTWAYGLSRFPNEEVEQIKSRPLPRWIDDLYLYNMPTWGHLFSPRQLLALITFGKWVRAAYQNILEETADAEFAKAVVTYLAMAVDRLADYNSILCVWDVSVEKIRYVFAYHALIMTWDYTEANPFSSGPVGWKSVIGWVYRYLARESIIPQVGQVDMGTATQLPFRNQEFDAVVIDPPWADNVPYADLSDFFYVWLRRIVGDLYPEAFRTTLVPKEDEAIVNIPRFGGGKKGIELSQKHYLSLLQNAFREIYRVLRPEGIAVLMFNHRDTKIWDRVILLLLSAGLYPTTSFPVDTEMKASLHQRGKRAIQSTFLIACRKRLENAPLGKYPEILTEMQEGIAERLYTLWRAGLRRGDLLASVIGPAVGIFGRYSKILDRDGQEVPVDVLLTHARRIIRQLAPQYLQNNGKEVSYDEAAKLAKAIGNNYLHYSDGP